MNDADIELIDCFQGSTVIFHCEAGGVPKPSLTWTVKSGIGRHTWPNVKTEKKFSCCAFLGEESDECWGTDYIWSGSVRNCFSDAKGDVGRI